MINTSAAFKNEIRGNRVMSLHDEYLFASSKRLKLSANDFVNYNIDESTSGQSGFTIGAAVIKKYTATLNNEDEKFSELDFEGLDILARVGLRLPDGTTEIVPKGRYRCVSAKSNEHTISLEAYDSMLFFDRSYQESRLNYPAKIREIVADACQVCGITYDETTVEQGDFIVENRPEEKNMTFRDVISYCAQIMGCYAKVDAEDKLVFGWYDFDTLQTLRDGYDGGNFKDYKSGAKLDGGGFKDYALGDGIDGGTFRETWDYHHLYSLGSQSINTDDITITGICVTAEKGDDEEEESYICGGDGYVLEIEKNPFIISGTKQSDKPSAQAVAEHIGNKIIGKTIRPLSISCQSNPAIEAGDCICVTDRKQRTYFTVITNTTYVFGGAQKVECSAETPTENNYEKYSAATKLLERADNETKRKISRYDIAVQHLTDVMAQSFGVFKTVEEDDSGAGIYYMHDKPRLEDSKNIWKMTAGAFAVSTDGGKTWNAGLDASGNAVVNVLSAIGINADWINTGTFSVQKDGKTVFYVDADTGRVDIVADSFSLSSGKTIEQIAQEKVYTQMNEFVSSVYDPDIAKLQAQIDGQIETWYYDYEPALDNMPASDWNTESERARHEGDLFYWKAKGFAYRFFKDGGSWKWQMVQDTDITKALAEAAQAQDTADSKRRVFVATPQPPYDIGDLWTQGVAGDIMRCQAGRQSGAYVSSDWVEASKYTDDTAVENLDKTLDSTEEIFNRLTQNGKEQCIKMDDDGHLYLNAEYIRTGILRSIKLINGKNGEFSVDENGNLVATDARITGNLSGSTIDNGNGTFVVDENGNVTMQSCTVNGTIVGKDGFWVEYTNTDMRPNTHPQFKFVDAGYESGVGAYLSIKAPSGLDAIKIGTKYYNPKPSSSKPYSVESPIFDNGIYAENAVINTLFQDYRESETITDEDGNWVIAHVRKSGAFVCIYGRYGTKSHTAGSSKTFPLRFFDNNALLTYFYPTHHSVKTVGYTREKTLVFTITQEGNLLVRNIGEAISGTTDIEITFRFDYFIF